MALLHVNFFSDVLGKCMNMDVILPQKTQEQIGLEGVVREGKYPTLYLLHGMSDDESCWIRRSSIERYVSDMGIAVVMPNGDLSWYSNTSYRQRYWTYLSEELPRICREFFPNMSDRPEDTFAAGNSMGGYGAFKLALARPDTFGAAAGLSSGLNIKNTVARNLADHPEERPYWESLFGPEKDLDTCEDNILVLARRLKESGKPLPKLYEWCGTGDFLYEAQKEVVEEMMKMGYDISYHEEEGTHRWDYWDGAVQDLLKWLPVRR